MFTKASPPPLPTEAEVDHVRALYEERSPAEAWRFLARHAPPEAWTDPAARILAARVAGNCGARGRHAALVARTFRRAGTLHSETAYYYALLLRHFRGAFGAWEFFRTTRLPDDASDTTRAHWLASFGEAIAAFHDSPTARRLLDEAGERAAGLPRRDRAWVLCLRAEAAQHEDRIEFALDLAREALAVAPDYRPALGREAELLGLLGREAEAVARLGEALDRRPSLTLSSIRAPILTELDRPEEALRELDRAEEQAPAADVNLHHWLAIRRLEAHYARGDFASAAIEADKLPDSDWHRGEAARLRALGTCGAPRRVLLPVPFVRQHDRTCAPATLAAITAFLGRPADHLAIAREICYDGTRDFQERDWLDRHGWHTREFRLDWDSAVALLEGGVPIALVTKFAFSGHLQAVIGHDAGRRTLLIRDPGDPFVREWRADPFLAEHAAAGPRALVAVPAGEPARAAWLDALVLPESAEYDALHRFRRAVFEHDHDEAEATLARLAELSPEGRLTLHARRELAAHDGDEAAELAALDRLTATFPNDAPLRVQRALLLDRLGRRPEFLAATEASLRARLENAGDWDAFLFSARSQAAELAQDEAKRPVAHRLLRRALRVAPMDSANLAAWADFQWIGGAREEAASVMRLAASLRGGDEALWQSAHQTERALGRADGLRPLFEERFRELGDRSALPALTLAWAWELEGDAAKADAVLAEALARRPADGHLRLFAAEMAARRGELTSAEEHLASARRSVGPTEWLRGAARVADLACDLPRSRSRWDGLLTLRPLDIEARRVHARRVAELEPEGVRATLRVFDEAAARFPHSIPLLMLRCEWAAEQAQPDEREADIRAVLATHPGNSWAWRELGFFLLDQRRLDEAALAAGESGRLEPRNPAHHHLLALLAEARGDRAATAAAWRSTIELQPDRGQALGGLLALAAGLDERREILRQAWKTVVAQPSVEGSAGLWATAARGVLDPPEVLAALRELHAARPHHLAVGLTLARELANAGEIADALALTRSLSARFPLDARAWMERADVAGRAGDAPDQEDSLRRALAIQPAAGHAARALAFRLRAGGRAAEALATMDAATRATPLDAWNFVVRAQLHRAAGRAEDAEADLLRATRLSPGFDDAWRELAQLCAERGDSRRVADLAREATTARPGDPAVWMSLANLLSSQPGSETEQLAALDRVAALRPHAVSPHDQRATLLASQGRWDEALAACAPSSWPADALPSPLRGRAAWIVAQQGNIKEARRLMRLVVEDDPAYEWGWSCLSEWAGASDDFDEMEACARQLGRIDPAGAAPLGYLADAQNRRGNRAAARASLREALRRESGYIWAANLLLELALVDSAWEDAEFAVASLRRRFGNSARAHHAELRLLAARRDFSAARDALARLGRAPDAELDMLRSDTELLSTDKAAARATADVLFQILAEPIARENVAVTAALTLKGRAFAGFNRRLAGITAPDARATFAAVYFEGLAERHKALGASAARRLARRHFGISPPTAVWAGITYALLRAGRWRLAARWSADWRERADAAAWQLSNVAIIQFARRRFAEARAVTEAGLERRERPPLLLLCMRALFRAVAEDAEGARADEQLAAVNGAVAQQRAWFSLAAAAARLASAAPGDTAAARDANVNLWSLNSSSDPALYYATVHLRRWQAARGRGIWNRFAAWRLGITEATGTSFGLWFVAVVAILFLATALGFVVFSPGR